MFLSCTCFSRISLSIACMLLRTRGGVVLIVMHDHNRMATYRPSHPYNVGMGHVGSSPTSLGGGVYYRIDFRPLMPPAAFRYMHSIYIYTPSRNRLIRSPFGGKRCIVDRLPLPPCCANGYCVAHLERPTGAACGRAPDEDLKMSALNMVFLQHDADGSGKTAIRQYRVLDTASSVSMDDSTRP